MLLNSLFSNRLVLKLLKSNDMICPFYLLHSQDVHPFAFFKGYGDVARRNTGRPCSSQQWHQMKPQKKKLTGRRKKVSTHLKNISQIRSFPQVGVEISNLWNHHQEKDSKADWKQLSSDQNHVTWTMSNPVNDGIHRPIGSWDERYIYLHLPYMDPKSYNGSLKSPNKIG